jgi:ribosomal protein S24E
MKIKILAKEEQRLLYRQLVKLEVEYDAEVPARTFLKEQIAKFLKVDQELVVVESINNKYGARKADVVVHVYTDKTKLDTFVPAHIKKRHEPKKKKGE